MNSSSAAPVSMRWLATLVLALAAAVLFLGPGIAQAKTTVSGKATFTLGAGKAGKALKKQGVKIKRVAPAKVKGLSGKRFRVVAPVGNVSTGPAKSPLKGGFSFRKGKRSVAVHGLVVTASKKALKVTGKLGGKKVNLFKGSGKLTTTSGNTTTFKLKNGKVKLTPAAAKVLRKRLKLKRVPAAAYGKLVLNAKKTTTPVKPPVDPCVADPNAEGCQPALPEDPYLAQCGVPATSQVAGTLTPAAPLPVLTNPKPLSDSPDLAWGFKESFRSYVNFGAGGSLHALDGATRDGMGPLAGFKFSVADGQYAANDPVDMTDDQAIINGKGTSVYCATGHEFRIVIKDPTIVIDGENSRIVADVDTNMTGVWTPAQRVDLATLDLEGITPFYNRNGTEVNWGEISTKLTSLGRDVFCRPSTEPGIPETCLYDAGEELDPVNVKLATEYDLGANDAAAMTALAEFASAEHPFPFSGAIGGCVPTIPAGGSAGDARTIDEHHAFGGSNYNWVADGERPAAAPDLSGGTAVQGGGMDWGVRTALRGSVNGTGEFNLFGGATASNTPYVGNGPGSLPYPQPGGTGQMSGGGKFFTWPAAGSDAGFYDAGGAGNADDRLVLKGTGRVGFCNVLPIMSYGTVLSNPTVVIDGDNSRITVEVATRFRLSWLRGRVDFAKIDLNGATFTPPTTTGDVTEVKWANAPVTLTENGSRVVNVLSSGQYIEGAVLDPVTVRATYPAGS